MSRAIGLSAVRTGVLIWACIHAVPILLRAGPSFTVATLILVPPIVAALVLLDQRISNEAVFVANLGIRPSLAPLAAGVATLVLELAVLLLSR